MLAAEARWVGDRVRALGLGPGATVIDVGSSSEEFRCLVQPHIDYEIFRPLREAGVRIVHVDARADDGVDVVADVTDPAAIPDELRGAGDVVLSASMLEHVPQRDRAVAALRELTRPGGHLIVTAPRRFPRHRDPVDTGYRPTADELAAGLGEGFEVSDRALIADAVEMRVTDGPVWRLAGRLALLAGARVVRRSSMPRTVEIAAVVAKRGQTP
jgi:SAM-dependent methyltransferase